MGSNPQLIASNAIFQGIYDSIIYYTKNDYFPETNGYAGRLFYYNGTESQPHYQVETTLSGVPPQQLVSWKNKVINYQGGLNSQGLLLWTNWIFLGRT